MVKVFVVSPGELHLFESAALGVDTIGSLVPRILAVGIGLKELVEHNLVGIRAADRKSIADDGPLRFAMRQSTLPTS
jgi:hypothetical protein